MQQVDREAFLEIQASWEFLGSIFKEFTNNREQFIRSLRAWNEKYGVNPLSGPTFIAFGWAIVVRFSELAQGPNGKLPDDLQDRLKELAASSLVLVKFHFSNQ